MGPCAGSANTRGPVEQPKSFTIYGHIIDNASRSLKMACDFSQKQAAWNEIDFIKQANTDSRYTAINPTGHIPMVEEGQFKVLGGNHVIYVYLCKHTS